MVSGVPPRTPTRRRTTVKKKVPVVSVAGVETANLAGLPLENDCRAGRSGRRREGGAARDLRRVGLLVMAQMLDAEMTARVGPKHAKIADRKANWHGSTDGPVVLGGRQVTVTRPRGRSVEGAEFVSAMQQATADLGALRYSLGFRDRRWEDRRHRPTDNVADLTPQEPPPRGGWQADVDPRRYLTF
jgi:hypothetical protein